MNNNGSARARRLGVVAAAVLAATTFSTTVALSCTAPAASRQVPAPAPETKREGPTAGEVLERAIARQGAPTGAKPAAELPLALRATTQLQFRDDKGNDVSLKASRRFLAPDRIWTEWTDSVSKTVTTSGFDGRRPWFFSPQKSVGLRWLDGPEGANDLKQLTADVEITSALARAFLLVRLKNELKDLKRLDDTTHRDVAKKEDWRAWVVEGDALLDIDGAKRKAKLRLFVQVDEARLIGVRVAIEGRDPMQIWFTRLDAVNGVEVPRRIDVFREGATEAQVTLYVSELDLAPNLTDADFAPPKPEK